MRSWIGVYALMLMTSVGTTNAADTPLTLAEAIALVLENNPQLQAADFDARAAAARIRQRSQQTPWQFGVALENFAGSGRAEGVDGLETTLSLGRVLELGDKPALRGAVARLQAGVLRHEQDAARLDVLTETAARFVVLARAQAEQALAQQQQELAQRTLKAVEKRYRVGKAAAAEVSRVQIGLARAELAVDEAAHRIATGRVRLAMMWGAYPPGFQSVQAELMRLSAEGDYDALEQALDNNPAIVRLATAERLADARLRLAQARRRPNVDINAGVRHFNDSDDLGLVLRLQMPLGSPARARPYESEAEALIRREPLLAQNTRLGLRATLFELYQELVHDRDRLHTLQQRIIPAAEKALADYTRGYTAGRYSLLELTQAQETLLRARREALEAAADYHNNRIQIDRLVGAEWATGAQS